MIKRTCTCYRYVLTICKYVNGIESTVGIMANWILLKQSETLIITNWKFHALNIHVYIFTCAFNAFDVFEAIQSLNIDREPQNVITG